MITATHSITWIEPDQQPSAATALEGRGYFLTVPHFFFFLPNYVAKLPLTPSAKWLFAMLVTESFPNDGGRFEYFKGVRTMARATGLSPSLVVTALEELTKAGMVWISDTAARQSDRGRHYYELGWTGDVSALAPDHGLKNADKPGPLTYAVKRQLSWFVPIYHEFAGTLRKLNKHYPVFKRTASLDMIVYGYVMAKARPFLFRSVVQIAADLGMHRQTVKAALDRLEQLYMIKNSTDGYYVVAHPALSTAPVDARSAELLTILEKVNDNAHEQVSC